MTLARHSATIAKLAGVWTVLILVACWIPREALPPEETIDFGFHVPNLDKLIHVMIFFGFGALWMLSGRVTQRRIGIVAVLGFVLMLVSEIGQTTPFVNRDASLMDGLADVVGLALGIWAALWLVARLENRIATAPMAVDNHT